NDAIDGRGLISGVRKRSFRRGFCQTGRMESEASVKGIRVQLECLRKIIQDEMPGGDTALARQNLFENGTRAGLELVEPLVVLGGLPAFLLCVPTRRRRGAQTQDNHGPK
ncbi:MAG TPA: hypothetical protein VHI52_17015, partial [Verrucomicrobiae bacterium]|nr:hypothetical protein [Verrucomicrobiae bacterium]